MQVSTYVGVPIRKSLNYIIKKLNKNISENSTFVCILAYIIVLDHYNS